MSEMKMETLKLMSMHTNGVRLGRHEQTQIEQIEGTCNNTLGEHAREMKWNCLALELDGDRDATWDTIRIL